MRFVIGEFAHETNTFCPGFTELSDFQRRMWDLGDDVIAHARGVRRDIGGMIDGADRLGIELVPTLATTTEPSATISRAAYETIRDELLTRIQAALPADAILLTLHGAGSADGIDDLEGTLLGELRAKVGTEIPIVVTLDLHGNTTDAMLENANILLYCHEYPHVDSYERGVEAVELAEKLVKGEINPQKYLLKLPLTISPSTTFVGPGKLVNDKALSWEKTPGVIDANFTHGFPHTDVSVIATSVLVTTDGDAKLAQEAAEDIAGFLLENLEAFHQVLPGADEAIAQALAETKTPVIVAEVSDNPGGGAPGSGTHLLRALLAANEPKTVFGWIWDPETAAQAHAAGAGTTIQVKLGGFTDELHGEPVETEAYVKVLSDGEFILKNPMGAGSTVRLGKMARLVIGNVDVIVASVRAQTLDAQAFLLHGIDVREYRVVAIKSQQHFRAGFEGIAGTIIRADTPGFTTSNLTLLPYQRITRPIWPLDPLPAL